MSNVVISIDCGVSNLAYALFVDGDIVHLDLSSIKKQKSSKGKTVKSLPERIVDWGNKILERIPSDVELCDVKVLIERQMRIGNRGVNDVAIAIETYFRAINAKVIIADPKRRKERMMAIIPQHWLDWIKLKSSDEHTINKYISMAVLDPLLNFNELGCSCIRGNPCGTKHGKTTKLVSFVAQNNERLSERHECPINIKDEAIINYIKSLDKKDDVCDVICQYIAYKDIL